IIFRWDDNRKIIVVKDDVWENYVKSHPDAKGFEYKPLTNYDELAIIVGKNNAKGVDANIGGELDKTREEVENNENYGHEDINGENEGSDKQLKRGLDEKQSTNKKVYAGDAIATTVTSMTDTFKSMVETNSCACLPTIDVNKLCQ
ncbi:hypothetical protein IFM89_013825, partial [Coptis chinensis]